MKFILLILSLLIGPHFTTSQFDDHAQITAHIKTMFDCMRNGDATRMPDLFEEGAMLESVFFNKEGKTISRQSEIADFIKAVDEPHDKIWDERIHNYDINIDGTYSRL